MRRFLPTRAWSFLGCLLFCGDALAQAPALVKDIDQRVVADMGSDPAALGQVGGNFLIVASLGPTGSELFRVVGSTAVLVRDINPGPADSAINEMVVMNGVGYFTARDGAGRELWRTDGTRLGTYRVVDLEPGPADGISSLAISAVVGTKLYFNADDTLTGSIQDLFLYKFDTSTPSTPPLKLLRGGVEATPITELVRSGTRVVFRAPEDSGGLNYEPCYTNASDAIVCVNVNSTSPSDGDSQPQQFSVAEDGTVYFAARTCFGCAWYFKRIAAGATSHTELGSTAHSGISATTAIISGSTSHTFVVRVATSTEGERLYRIANTATAFTEITQPAFATPFVLASDNNQIFFSAGDAGGANPRVFSIGAVSTLAFGLSTLVVPQPDAFYGANDVFACRTTGATGSELYYATGLSQGSIIDIAPPYYQKPDAIEEITSVGETLFLSALDSANRHLWISDGSGVGTVPHPGGTLAASAVVDPEKLQPWQNGVVFVAGDSVYYATTTTLDRLYQSSRPLPLLVGVAGTTLLVGDRRAGSLGPVTYRKFTSQTDAGTDIGAFGGNNNTDRASSVLSCNSGVCYISTTYELPTYTRRIYYFNGTSASASIYEDTVFGDLYMTMAGTSGYFSGSGKEPYRADGASVALLKDIAPLAGSSPKVFTAAGSRVFFFADDEVHGRELWVEHGQAC